MCKNILALMAGVAIAMAACPAIAGTIGTTPCSPGGASGTVQLADNGSETIDSFNCGSEFEFSFTNSGSGNEYLDMAFGGTTSFQYEVEGKAAPPGSYDEINYYSGGTSTFVGYGPGTWDIYVSLIQVPLIVDPFGGFRLTDTGYDLPIPNGFATPLPSTWTMMLFGLVALGIVAYRQRRTAALAVA
jgi:hypothetical protein